MAKEKVTAEAPQSAQESSDKQRLREELLNRQKNLNEQIKKAEAANEKSLAEMLKLHLQEIDKELNA